MDGTAQQMRMFYMAAAERNMQFLNLRAHSYDIIGFTEQLAQVKGFVFQHHGSGFQLIHIQNAVDQIQKEAGSFFYFAAAFCLLFHIIRILLRNPYHALNAIDGCPDVMTHAAQKIRLCNVRAARFFRSLQQLLPVFDLHLFLLVDLTDYIQNIGHLSILVTLLHNESCKMPGTADGLILHGNTLGLLKTVSQRRSIQEPFHHLLMFRDNNGFPHFLKYLRGPPTLPGQLVYLISCRDFFVGTKDQIHPVDQPVNLADSAHNLTVKIGDGQRMLQLFFLLFMLRNDILQFTETFLQAVLLPLQCFHHEQIFPDASNISAD